MSQYDLIQPFVLLFEVLLFFIFFSSSDDDDDDDEEEVRCLLRQAVEV